MTLVRGLIIALALTVWAGAWLALDGRLFAILRNDAFHLVARLYRAHPNTPIAFSLYAGLFVVEWLVVGWRDSSLRRLLAIGDRSTRSDVAVSLTAGLPFFTYFKLATTVGLVMLTSAQGAHLIRGLGIPFPGIAQLPLLAQLVVLYLTYTFLDYWGHRLSHSRWVWPLHRFHHAATDFCIFTSSRVHPTDISGSLLIFAPMALLAPAPGAMLGFALGIAVLRHVLHSRIPHGFGFLGEWVVQTPTQHRWHHALETGPWPVGNFSLCPLWDRIFGTWRRVESADFAIGVSDREYRHGFWYLADLWRDYCDFLAGLRDAAMGLERKVALRRGAHRPGMVPVEP